jgi:hypothetical protein
MATTNPNEGELRRDEPPTPPPDNFDYHHGDEPPTGVPAADVVRQGHEPDKFYVKPILAVPAAVVLFFVIGFIVTTLVFRNVNTPIEVDKSPNPLAVARNSADLNKRLDRIGIEKDGQPRLEGLRMRDNGSSKDEPANAMTTTQTPLPVRDGNSPEYHPEDLRPDRWVDPVTGHKPLMEYGWIEKDKIARMPIDKAIALALSMKTLPTQANPVDPNAVPAGNRPKASNSGRGIAPSQVPTAKAEPTKAAEGKGEGKK